MWCGIRAERAAGAGVREPSLALADDGGGGSGRARRRHGEHLVVIEGAARGADHAAHLWCQRHGLPEDRHRCHPVDWRTERRARPRCWRLAGPERNSRMLLQDRPRLIVCFHDQFDPASGGASDMALRGLIRQVPVWLVSGEDPAVGRWLSLELFRRQRASRTRGELDTFPSLGRPPEGAGLGTHPAEAFSSSQRGRR